MIDLTENTPESTKHALPMGKYEKRSIRWNTTSLLYLGNLTRVSKLTYALWIQFSDTNFCRFF